jgi:2-polyprenyl-3-methyl-5-hydroxy-6-metoxy-1,4-benzoquinol methylase
VYQFVHKQEVDAGQRFEFGKNWQRFLQELTEQRIIAAETSLTQMLELRTLQGKSFLDIGSGSGLFSLAARRLGAQVHSFDYDPDSASCTAALKRRFFPDEVGWTIEQGSVLDQKYMKSLGPFDIVYSWGVLHHTGAMWQALENAADAVAPAGSLFIALYNDQGKKSQRWLAVKRAYNRWPLSRPPILGYVAVRAWGRRVVNDTLRGTPLRTWQGYECGRGMSPWRDVVDWAGGYPYEVAKPDDVVAFGRRRGLVLEKLVTNQGNGNNEFVLRRVQ